MNDSPPLLRRAIVLSLIAACAMPVVSLVFVFPMINEIPRWDQWSLIPLWEDHCAGRPVLPHLVKPYNGHMNLLARFVFYAAGALTGWDLRVEVLLIYLTATATAATLVCMLRDSDDRLLLLAAPVVALVFSFVHFETFLTGYNLGQQLEQLALTVSLFLLTRPRLTARHVLGGAAAAAAATFSWGGGLVAWPLGFAALAARQWRRPVAAALWIVPAALCALAVKRGAVGGQPLGIADLLQKLDPEFIFTMLGKVTSLRAFPEPADALPQGVAVTLAFGLGLAWAWISRRWLLGLRWGLIGAAALGQACLISLSRSGLQQALASHYATATYTLTVSVVVFAGFALLLQAAGPGGRIRRWTAALVLAALMGATGWQVQKVSRETYLVVRGWHSISTALDEKLLAGTITDPEIQGALHPDTLLVRRGTAVLRDCRLTVFDDLPPPP